MHKEVSSDSISESSAQNAPEPSCKTSCIGDVAGTKTSAAFSRPAQAPLDSSLFTSATWRLNAGEASALIAARGAVVLDWNCAGVPVIDGYSDQADMESGAGCRCAVMAPWSNRIQNARYAWMGQEYDLGPAPDGSREANHGLMLNTDFERIDDGQDPASLTLHTVTGGVEGYPWPIDVRVTYRIHEKAPEHGYQGYRLELEINARNLADVTVPVGLGWHPYFHANAITDQGLDSLYMELPAKTEVVSDDMLIPLEGSQAFKEADYAHSQCGRIIVELKGWEVDTSWTDLWTDKDGLIRSYVVGSQGHLVLTQDTPVAHSVVHAFTGDTLPTRKRQSLALEPCWAMTNAFKRIPQVMELEPGQTRSLHASVDYVS